MNGENNSKDARALQDAIMKLIGVGPLKDCRILIGEVKIVRADDRECDVDAVLGEETIRYSGVNLSPERNDGLIQVPAVDSSVICCQMPNGEVYVLAFSDVDKIICFIDGANKFVFDASGFVWNGGALGGLIKIDDLKSQWDSNVSAIKTAVSGALAIIDTQLVALGQAGGSAASFNTAAASIIALVKATLEDTKIKH